MGMKDIATNRQEEFPPEGWEGIVTVLDARDGETTKGFPKFGLHLAVTEGPDFEESFWDNVFFSGNAKFNHQSLLKLEAAGISQARWNDDPEPEEIAEELIGNKFMVRATWDPNEDDPSRPWLRCTYFPLDGGLTGDVSTPDGFG